MITLNEYKAQVQDKWDTTAIIDELQKSNVLFSLMPFDDTVTPTGSSFPYSYFRKTTESGAAFRKVGEEYTPSEAKVTKQNAEVKILGGTYKVDRAIAKASENGFINEVEFQTEEKVKGVSATFNNCLINGDSTTNEQEFDGLDKILTGTTTEFTSAIDLSTAEKVDANYMGFIDEIDGVISEMNGEPTVIAGNNKMIAKIKSVARRAGQYQETKDDIGRTISMYGNAVLVDLGAKPASSDPVVGINAEGKTDLYFIRIAKDAFHGITLDGKMIDVVTPDREIEATTGLTGLVEMYGACVLKSTKGAAVLRGIKVKGV